MNVGNVNFGKRYPTVQVLEVATGGYPLTTENRGKGWEKLFADMTTKEEKIADDAYWKEKIKNPNFESDTDPVYEYQDMWRRRQNELIRQFPVLKEIIQNANEFFSVERDPKETNNWIMEQIGIIGKDTLDVKLPSETENETNISNDEAPKQRKLPFAAKLLGCTIVIGAAILASLKLLK